ncbi:MAG: ABC transporter ATP-binding protein [Candidatus Thiodiazotropha sp. (ex Dulcina madagascariensis)]|nr:ABC transporter ATP-binding protein [Candidatus Thiodiazotropha sp. (ex Dulcina madagascariensis)]
MSDPVILALSALNKRFGKREVLRDIAFELRPGECTLLSGGNGAGKTTLLRILSGLERPDRGRIDTGKGPLSWRRSKAALQKRVLYLHQQPYMFDGSVRYNLGYALPGGVPKPLRNALIDTAIDWAELGPLDETPAKSLSGGERQRVSLARARLRNPRILLLDEPTANLDQAARRRTLDLLKCFKQEGVSLLLASHDPMHFSSLIDRHLHLYDGRLAALEDQKLMQIPPLHTLASLRSTA